MGVICWMAPALTLPQAVGQAGQAMVSAASCVALGAAAARMLGCAFPARWRRSSACWRSPPA